MAQKVPTARSQQKRSLERINLLLGTTEALLDVLSVDEISLADVASKAGVPLPSVYNFFPNKTALLEALAMRFHDELMTHMERCDAEQFTSWQELVAYVFNVGADYHTSHACVMKLFLGPGVSAEIKNADLTGNSNIAATYRRMLQRRFVFPFHEELENRLSVAVVICDSVWALSFCKQGSITPELRVEGIRAAIAYLRLYLPEYLTARS